MELTTVWFVVVAFFWTGYLVLEGFDFGVGMLAPAVSRTDAERGTALQTIGPVWDGNEVWMVVAVGATFAAFPLWYASLLSALYLPFLFLLLALIVRGVALEFRGKRDDARWRRRWGRALVVGSVLPALVWGAVLATLVAGLPVDAHGDYTGSAFAVFGPAGALGAVAVLALCLLHGAVFLALRSGEPLRTRASTLARRFWPLALLAVAAFLVWAQYMRGDAVTLATAAAALLALVGALAALAHGREGWAFAGTAGAIALTVVTVFVALYPDVLPSTVDPRWSLTVQGAAASPYALGTMSVVAAVFAPLVLLYQAWSYWVFRKRVLVPG
ncbi:MAG: cytochrome d ubiquinol oxidase subunit II [Streptosporangiales bacterium]